MLAWRQTRAGISFIPESQPRIFTDDTDQRKILYLTAKGVKDITKKMEPFGSVYA